MKKAIRVIAVSSTVIVVLIAIALLVFWTPDTASDAMLKKYSYAESGFIQREDGSVIHYTDQGQSNDTALVFIHGTGSSLHTWQPLIAQLGANYRFVSLDLPGHGFTSANPQRDYSHRAMVTAVWDVMTHLGIENATLVGNSLGGGIAWQAALDEPARVNALILLAPSGVPRSESRSNIGFKILKNPIGQILMRKIAPRSIIEASLRQSVSNEAIVSELMIDRYWELLRYPGNRQAMIDMQQTERDRDAWLGLTKLFAPTLIVWGKDDGVLPVTMAQSFSDKMPNMELVVLDGVGHLPMEESVSKVSTLMSQFCQSNRC